MKKLILFASLLGVSLGLSAAISEFPYTADWKYASDAIGNNAGYATDDPSYYDLGGWILSPAPGSEASVRPFVIPFTGGAPIANALQFKYDSTDEGKVAYAISPEFDFSNETKLQVISFKCGKNDPSATYYNLDVVYTTNYTGDASTTEWTEVGTALIEDSQYGMGSSGLASITLRSSIVGANARLALRACNSNPAITPIGMSFRVTNFKVDLEDKPAVYDLPYTASWQYKSEYLTSDGATINTDVISTSDIQKDEAYMDLGGWVNYKEKGSKIWAVVVSKGVQSVNFMEWTDDCISNPGSVKTWFISPKINFSDETVTKTVSFAAGKEKAEMLYSNLSFYYSTDYTNDVKAATWQEVDKNIIPDDQAGVGTSKLTAYEKVLDIVAPEVTFAIVGDVYNTASTQTSQTKARLYNFKITTTSPTGINDIAADRDADVTIIADGDALYVAAAQKVAKVAVVNAAGAVVMNVAAPEGAFSTARLNNGVYIAVVTLADGRTVAKRFVKH